MPRIPKLPECDCHYPVSASEDIKLKILEANFDQKLLNKQDKLTEGSNIDIDSANKISGVLTQQIVTDVAVGGIPAGYTLEVGTPLDEIISKIFHLGRTLNSIAITTPPSKTTYNVGESFNPAGMVVKGYYSDQTTEVITNYTYSPSGALTATDTKITVSYGGKTAEQAITVVAPVTAIKIYKGVVDAIPTSISGLTEVSIEKEALLTDGYLYKNITTNNQYAVLAVPKSAAISCYDIKVAGFSMGFITKDLGDYYLYHFDSPTTESSARYQYLFEEE